MEIFTEFVIGIKSSQPTSSIYCFPKNKRRVPFFISAIISVYEMYYFKKQRGLRHIVLDKYHLLNLMELYHYG